MHRRKQKDEPRRQAVPERNRAGVFSYYANRSADQRNVGRREPVESLLVQRDRLPRVRLASWQNGLIITTLVILVLFDLTLTTKPKVSVVNSQAPLSRSTQAYQQVAQSIIGRSLLSYTKLTINTKAISQQLQDQFPEIDSVVVSVPIIGRRPNVTVETAQPAFILAGQGGAFYIDGNGRALARPSDASAPVKNMVTVTDESGVTLMANKVVLPKDTVDFIATIIQQLRAKNVPIASMSLPAAPYELQVKTSDAPYYIRFNTLEDGREQAGTYLAVRDKLSSDKVTPQQYIDVRASERAFYK